MPNNTKPYFFNYDFAQGLVNYCLHFTEVERKQV